MINYKVLNQRKTFLLLRLKFLNVFESPPSPLGEPQHDPSNMSVAFVVLTTSISWLNSKAALPGVEADHGDPTKVTFPASSTCWIKDCSKYVTSIAATSLPVHQKPIDKKTNNQKTIQNIQILYIQ